MCVDGACVDLICAPNDQACVDEDTYHVCNGEGTAWGPDMDCPPDSICQFGECVSQCELAELTKSNIGCEFWAVDIANLPPRDTYTFATTVSNPSFTDTVTVRIYDKNGGNENLLIEDTIPPSVTSARYDRMEATRF